MPKKLFIQIFKQYCQSNGIECIKNIESLFELPFLAKNLVIINYRGHYRRKMYTDQDFIFGIDTVEVNYSELEV